MRKAAPRAPVQGSARVAAARPTERRLTMGGRQQWYAGVDWGSQSHHVVLTDGDGRKIGERSFKHGGEGLAEMAAWLMAASCAAEPGQILAAIEVPHGPVVETLMERGFKVHAINPKQMDRFRDRFTMAGAKDDSRDAEVMASALRTDPRCFRSLAAADPIIVELREWSRIAEDLGVERNRLINRLREQLWRYFPALLELEDDLGAEWLLELWEPRRRRNRPAICARRRSPNCSNAIASAASTPPPWSTSLQYGRRCASPPERSKPRAPMSLCSSRASACSTVRSKTPIAGSMA